MDELTAGLRRLRLSLITLLLSQTALALMESHGMLFSYDVRMPSLLSSTALAILAYTIALRGLTNVCNALSGAFCVLGRLTKYLLPVAIFFTAVGVSYAYEDLRSLGLDAYSLSGRPILLLAAILMVLLELLVSYSLMRLGSSVGSRAMVLGSLLLVPSPFVVMAGYTMQGSLIGALGSLVSMISLTALIRAGMEVVEEEEGIPEGHEEPEQVPPRPRKVLEESRVMRGRVEMETLEEAPPKPRERKARLIGPNGLAIELEPGVRVVGRRDFVGYVPEGDLEYISRRHFEIRCGREGFFIRDLGSLNGTWVNGSRLGREYIKLTNGSVIDVAEVVRLRFSLESEDLGVPEI